MIILTLISMYAVIFEPNAADLCGVLLAPFHSH
jgi:hypothetical protein